jgi:hypothetical protein
MLAYAFLLAALNDVNMLATGTGNVSSYERDYEPASPEFEAELQGEPVWIVIALQGLKSSV